MQVERPKSASGRSRKRRKPISDPGLLGDLIESRFFLVLLGKATPFGPVPKKILKTIHSQKKQSVVGMGIDLIIFAVLVVLAPIYGLSKFVMGTVGRYWWVRFVSGIATGVAVLFSVYRVLSWIF